MSSQRLPAAGDALEVSHLSVRFGETSVLRHPTFSVAAVGISVASTLLGTWMAWSLGRQTGPLIVLVPTAAFALSLLVPQG